ncbi:MAG: MBL fold metallo-hydrolase [Acidobacteria bacterium]|nr:MBL fold metallo-hydrolase [Acidobacteriota bacterium]
MKRVLVCFYLAPLLLMLAACSSEPAAEPDTAAQPQQQGPTRSITNITGDLYRAQNNNHFTALLVTPEGIIMSDPINREFATWLKGELAARFNVPVRYVLYSHSDFDHASGGEVFADTAEFIGHENMPAALELPSDDMPLPENAAAMDADGNGKIEMAEATGNFQNNFALFDANEDGMLSGAEIARGPVSDVYPPTDTYSDRTTITLGGKSVEMIHPGTQHSANMSILHFIDESAVFVVDFLSLRRLPFRTMAGYNLDEWLQEIRFVEDFGAEIVMGGHGDVGTTADVAEVRQYLEELRDAVAAGMEAGSSLEELQGSITMEAYSDWNSYTEWLPLNIEGMYNMLAP